MRESSGTRLFFAKDRLKACRNALFCPPRLTFFTSGCTAEQPRRPPRTADFCNLISQCGECFARWNLAVFSGQKPEKTIYRIISLYIYNTKEFDRFRFFTSSNDIEN